MTIELRSPRDPLPISVRCRQQAMNHTLSGPDARPLSTKTFGQALTRAQMQALSDAFNKHNSSILAHLPFGEGWLKLYPATVRYWKPSLHGSGDK